MSEPRTAQDAQTAGVPRLEASHLSKSFTGQLALCDLDLTIQAGQVHALVGENGSGKSTFIKILAGYHVPDPGGQILIDGERLKPGSPHSSRLAGCRFVHQDLALVDSVSVGDNLAFGSGFDCRFGTIAPGSSRRRALHDLRRVGLEHLDPRTPVRNLTAAVRTGVAVARALRDESGGNGAKLLVLDEPTATLPDNEVEQLMAIVRSVAASGVSVLYVTHRLDEIFNIAAHVTVLRDGRKVAERPVSSLNRKELVSILVGSEFEDIHAEVAALLPAATERAVLEVGSIASAAVRSVSFGVAGGEVVGIAGITGSGRETLLSAIFGAVPIESGSVRVGPRTLRPGRPAESISAGMAFLPADRKRLGAAMNLGARENMTISHLTPYWRRGLINRRAERREVASWFTRLAVRPADAIERPLATFSGGNQQKILFAKWLRRQPEVLLLDEPTQGVDVAAKAELHRHVLQAAARGAAVVVSSSDADELAALCQRVLVLRDGVIAADLRGSKVSVVNIARESLGIEREKVSAK